MVVGNETILEALADFLSFFLKNRRHPSVASTIVDTENKDMKLGLYLAA